MPKAFVLINAEAGFEDKALKECQSIEYVTEAYAAYGVYDIILRLEAETMKKLKDIITDQIRKIDLVRSTLTMIQME